jgi:hypothetical protein
MHFSAIVRPFQDFVQLEITKSVEMGFCDASAPAAQMRLNLELL